MINITEHIEFSTNEIIPDVYTNVHHKLICAENSEQMLLNCTQIDWQEAYLKNINRIPELSDATDFRLNTSEELLWIIDRLVAQIFTEEEIEESLSVKQNSIPTYTGSAINIRNYITVTYTRNGQSEILTEYHIPDNIDTTNAAKNGRPIWISHNTADVSTVVNFKINPKQFNITTTNQQTSSKTNIDSTQYTNTGLITGIGHTLTNVVLSVNNSNEIVVSSYDIVDSNNVSVKSNYTLNQTKGTWTQQTGDVTYYWYAGWTIPTAENISTIINEEYPTRSTDPTLHKAGGFSTTNTGYSLGNPFGGMSGTNQNRYNATAKVVYYVVVPVGMSIYDPEDGSSIMTTFVEYGEFENHKIYAYNGTSRNINNIYIY